MIVNVLFFFGVSVNLELIVLGVYVGLIKEIVCFFVNFSCVLISLFLLVVLNCFGWVIFNFYLDSVFFLFVIWIYVGFLELLVILLVDV